MSVKEQHRQSRFLLHQREDGAAVSVAGMCCPPWLPGRREVGYDSLQYL